MREIARGNNLLQLVKTLSKSSFSASDIVVWDLGIPENPTMSVVASTCRGWLTFNKKKSSQMSEDYGVSFTPREMKVLKQFFDIWKLESGQNITSAINNIYEQTYVKNFTPGPDQIKLDKSEFNVFVNKLLKIVKE